MRMRTEIPSAPLARRLACLLAAATAAAACATPGAPRPAPVALAEGGFTLTEKVRVGAGVRSDFEHGVLLLKQQQYESGIALLVAVTEAAPQLTAAHIDLAIAYREHGDLEKAEASIEKALELSPRHPVAHNERGILLRREGRFQEARASYEQALAIHPQFQFARLNLAILCDVYLADESCALEQYQIYTAAVPDDQSAAMWLADLRNRAGR